MGGYWAMGEANVVAAVSAVTAPPIVAAALRRHRLHNRLGLSGRVVDIPSDTDSALT